MCARHAYATLRPYGTPRNAIKFSKNKSERCCTLPAGYLLYLAGTQRPRLCAIKLVQRGEHDPATATAYATAYATATATAYATATAAQHRRV